MTDPRISASTNPPGISARLLGLTEVWIGERLLPSDAWPRRSARSLLLLLLSTPGYALRRDEVVETLWPELSPDAALNELYKALHALRRVLEPDLQRGSGSRYLRAANETLTLSPDLIATVDVAAFEHALNQAASASDPRADFREAIERYTGEFLADEPYSEWPLARREQLRAAWTRAVLDLAELDLAAGSAGTARPALLALLAADATNEAAHRALIRLYLATSRPDAARRQYAACVEALHRELGVEPEPETEQLLVALSQPAPPIESASTIPPPQPPTRLIGRAVELTTLSDLFLGQQARLVTLTGPGGIGKTHLALTIAAEIAGEFRDGAAFAGLAAIREVDEALLEIARSLGVLETSDQHILDLIARSLVGQELLLVIDNLEQVIAIAPALADLLARVPGLRILATSRERLHLRGEQIVEIGPLPTPRPDRPATPSSIARFDAVQLFEARVRDRHHDFTVAAESAPIVAEICRRLDGIPLAIELVAAQSATLTLAQISQRLERRLDLLVDGPLDLPDRLRTMRNAIAWSFQLLSPVERAAASPVSLFPDGATEALAGQLYHRLNGTPTTITPLLASLVTKSVLRLDLLDDPPRYRMLETVREFGIEQLQAAGQFDRAMDAYCAVYTEALTAMDSRLTGDDQIYWYEWLQAEHQNIRLALTYAIRESRAESALAMTGGVWRFWSTRGYGVEGLAWLEQALAIDCGDAGSARASALRAAGRLAEDLTDYERAERYQQQALAAWEALGDQAGQALAYDDLGCLAHDRGAFALADELHLQALRFGHEAGHERVIMSSLSNLGASAWRRGDHERALDYFSQAAEITTDPLSRALVTANRGVAMHGLGRTTEALALAEESHQLWKQVGSRRGIADSLLNMADVQQRTGQLEAAETNAQGALTIYDEIGERYGVQSARQSLAVIARLSGDLDGAGSHLKSALAIASETGDRSSIMMMLDEFALIAFARGELDGAVTLATLSELIRNEIDAHRGYFERRDRDTLMTALSPLTTEPPSLDELIATLLA